MNAEQLKDSLKVNAAIFTLMEINDKYNYPKIYDGIGKGNKQMLDALREQLQANIREEAML